MKSSELDAPIEVYYKMDVPDVQYQRKFYEFVAMDWAKVNWLETIKDNETETAISHDSAFAIARLTFRYEPNFLNHTSTNLYKMFDKWYEAVGMPTIRHLEGIVYINVKTRDDIGEPLID